MSIGVIYSSRTIYLPSLKLLGQSVVELSVAQGEVDWHDLWPWPTDLNINRGHLLIKDYLPTKFEACGAKPSWVISCTRLRDTDITTDIQTDMCKAICPSFFKGKFTSAILRTDYLCTDSLFWIHPKQQGGLFRAMIMDAGARCCSKFTLNSKLPDKADRWEIYVNPCCT